MQPRTVAAIQELIGRADLPAGSDLLQFRSLGSAHQYRYVYQALETHVRARARVLDWGAGNGHFSWVLARLGFETVAYTLESNPLGWLEALGCEVARGSTDDPVHLPFPDSSFDAVASIGVLEHVSETGGSEGESLREVARVLRPGGAFLCAHLPNRHSLIEAVSRWIPGKYSHRFRYDRSKVKALFQVAGLHVTELRAYGALPRNMWRNAPRFMRSSVSAVRVFDALDTALERAFPRFCQNHLVVAHKPPDSDAPDVA